MATETYIPYSALDGSGFWIPSRHYGRDYWDKLEALEHGAVEFFNEQLALDRWRKSSVPMTAAEIEALCLTANS